VTRRVAIAAGFATIAGIAARPEPVLAAPAAPVPDSAIPPLRGTWRKEIIRAATALQMTFRFAGNSMFGSTLAISTGTASDANGPLIGGTGIRMQSVRLQPDVENRPSFVRDAGTFALLDYDGHRIAGDALFTADADFAKQLRAHGISLSDGELMQLGLSGSTVRDVALTRSAFRDADIPTIGFVTIRRAAENVGPLKNLLPAMTARDLQGFLVFDITPSYVADLREAGLRELTPDDVTRLKMADVDGAFVRGRTVDGIAPSVPELIEAKRKPRESS
jgi:hypothetical protein